MKYTSILNTCQLSTLKTLFIQHLLSQISSKAMMYMEQAFSRHWGHTIYVQQVLQYKLMAMVIGLHMDVVLVCCSSTDIEYIINPRGNNR